MKLIITRPRNDAEALGRKLHDMGHAVVMAPLLEIVANPVIEIPGKHFAALLVTSANGIRCLPSLAVPRDLRVIAVGAQSAQAARDRGFLKVEAHGGDVGQLASWIAEHLSPAAGPLLYVTGKEISGDLAGVLMQHGFEVTRIETYLAKARALTLTAGEIAACDGVLLYSLRSAKLWYRGLMSKGLIDAAAGLHHYCLSPAVAHILPQDWHISVASKPTEPALLQLLEPVDKEG